MLKHHYECAFAYAFECLWQVGARREWWFAVVFGTCYDDGVGFATYHTMFVEQQIPPKLSLSRNHFAFVCDLYGLRTIEIHAVIVVAQHRKHTIASAQAA